MIRTVLFSLFMILPVALFAQSKLDLVDEEIAQQILEDLARANEEAVPTNTVGKLVPRKFATLRFLDRLHGSVKVLEVERGNSVKEQHLKITEKACFVPAGDAASDALVYLTIEDDRNNLPVFDGWMLASSPALSALEHPRYDVWAVSCLDEARLTITGEEKAPPPRPETLGG